MPSRAHRKNLYTVTRGIEHRVFLSNLDKCSGIFVRSAFTACLLSLCGATIRSPEIDPSYEKRITWNDECARGGGGGRERSRKRETRAPSCAKSSMRKNACTSACRAVVSHIVLQLVRTFTLCDESAYYVNARNVRIRRVFKNAPANSSGARRRVKSVSSGTGFSLAYIRVLVLVSASERCKS